MILKRVVWVWILVWTLGECRPQTTPESTPATTVLDKRQINGIQSNDEEEETNDEYYDDDYQDITYDEYGADDRNENEESEEYDDYEPVQDEEDNEVHNEVQNERRHSYQEQLMQTDNVESNEIPRYSYKYGVEDHSTGDMKSAREERVGNVVTGEYSLLQPDGVIRIVKYTADDKNGFKATVHLHHGVTFTDVKAIGDY